MQAEQFTYRCKFPLCTNRYTMGVENKHYFRFPKNSDLCSKWKDFCHIDQNTKVTNFRLCEDHFDKSDYWNSIKNRLKREAIPSLPVAQSVTSSSITSDVEEFVESCVVHNDHNYCKTDGVISSIEADHDYLKNENFETDIEKIIENYIENNTCGDNITKITEFSKFDFLEDHTYFELKDLSESYNKEFLDESTSNLKDISTSCKSRGFLATVGLNKKDLTPNEQVMYNVHRNTICKLSKLKQCLKSDRDKIKSLRTICENGKFNFIESNLNKITKEFINSQLRNVLRKGTAKRWSLQDKSFALSIYKRSPRVYRYLSNYFELPSITTLKELLFKIPFETGINEMLMSQLRNQVSQMDELNRNCVLLFDEISLDTVLHYEQHKEYVSGYVDLGHLGRKNQIADHALVFMVRGIRKSWKQVIAYYFTAKTVSTQTLKELIVKVIAELQQINLKVVATVCDQGSTNRAALNALVREENSDPTPFYFKVNKEPVCIIYDVPHLLKNTRNALLRCVWQFDVHKKANFEHIENAFNLDQQKRTFKMLPRLKQDHFNFKDSRMKMKVKVAAAQLSYSVTACIETWVASGNLPSEAANTAEFVHKIDSLFDSLNGYSFTTPEGKPLKGVLKSDSPHIKFWSVMLKELRDFKLFDKSSGKDVTFQFKFLKGWQTTIRSMIYLWNRLEKQGFSYFSLRSFNQDPLENLFCAIRQHGLGNTNPTCHQFVAALKTTVINGLTSPISNGNCEKDDCEALNNLSFYFQTSPEKVDDHVALAEETNTKSDNVHLLQQLSVGSSSSVSEDDLQPASRQIDSHEFPPPLSDCQPLRQNNAEFELSDENNNATPYVAGYILRQVSIPECEICHNDLICNEPSEEHIFIMFKEFSNDKCKLIYPSKKVIKFVEDVHEKLYMFLRDHGHSSNLFQNFKQFYSDNFLCFQFCLEHNMKELLFTKTLKLVIFKYIKDKKRASSSSYQGNKSKKLKNGLGRLLAMLEKKK